MVEGKLRLRFAAFRFAARKEKFDGLVALAIDVRIEVKVGVALTLTFDLSKRKVAKIKVQV